MAAMRAAGRAGDSRSWPQAPLGPEKRTRPRPADHQARLEESATGAPH